MKHQDRIIQSPQSNSSLKENKSIATADSPLHPHRHRITLQISFIHEIFQSEPQSKLLSSKITKKSVSWLMRVSWEKDCSLQSTWTALTLFYGYRRRRTVNKQQLQCLLLTCLQLSTKFHESVPLRTNELFSNCSQAVSRDLFAKYQLELLELFDFQIYVPHALQTLASCQSLSEQQRWKVLFLAELYLCKDDQILFDWQKCEQLIVLIRGEALQCELQCLEIRELINQGSNGVVFKKYGSKFDIQMLTNSFL